MSRSVVMSPRFTSRPGAASTKVMASCTTAVMAALFCCRRLAMSASVAFSCSQSSCSLLGCGGVGVTVCVCVWSAASV